MINSVITGGQTGADQAGWRAAKRFGIPTGGWMPAGFHTEDGKRPEFADIYGAKEHESPQYADRTGANVAEAHVLLWIGNPWSPGGRLTLRLWRETRPPMWLFLGVIDTSADPGAALFATLISEAAEILGHDVTVMIAGNRESKAPGIGAWVEDYLCDVFRELDLEERENG